MDHRDEPACHGLGLFTQVQRFRQFLQRKSEEKTLPFPIYKTAFVASALGRQWATDVTHEECRDVMLGLGCVPSVTLGEKEYFPPGHPLSLTPRLLRETGEQRDYVSCVDTSHGPMSIQLAEFRQQSLTLVKGPAEKPEDLQKVIWYLRQVREHVNDVREQVAAVKRQVGPDCLVVFFLPQPYELYCIFNREEALFLQFDHPELFAELTREIFDTVLSVIVPALEGGADLFFFGSAGTELYSPTIFKNHLLQPSIEYARRVRGAGGYSTFHLCGRGKEYLDIRVFEHMPVHIVEGLGMPPTGNIPSLNEAASRIPASIFLRGNVSLDLLKKAPAEKIHEEAVALQSSLLAGRLILSGECDILFGTPSENVAALVRACPGGARISAG
jgi:uroporphyrinogen-III decarboxylase